MKTPALNGPIHYPLTRREVSALSDTELADSIAALDRYSATLEKLSNGYKRELAWRRRELAERRRKIAELRNLVDRQSHE